MIDAEIPVSFSLLIAHALVLIASWRRNWAIEPVRWAVRCGAALAAIVLARMLFAEPDPDVQLNIAIFQTVILGAFAAVWLTEWRWPVWAGFTLQTLTCVAMVALAIMFRMIRFA